METWAAFLGKPFSPSRLLEIVRDLQARAVAGSGVG
jgi:hypothetical protein